jgi:Gtp-binding protein of the ras superfamily involved in termination of M-phase
MASSAPLVAGTGQNPHPLLENNEEKNRYGFELQPERDFTRGNILADAVFRSVVVKVGMVGDSQIGKTSLMVKYVEGSFDEDYIQTLGSPLLLLPLLYRRSNWRYSTGVNFMEKTISVRRTTITFSIWDLGGV